MGIEFIAVSDYLKKVKKVAEKGAQLQISLYIWGEEGTGKHHLARYISYISPVKPVIVEESQLGGLKLEKNRFIVAVGKTPFGRLPQRYFFDTDIYLAPLTEHREDIPFFVDHFITQARRELKVDRAISLQHPDISQNLHSLKRQIYQMLLAPASLEELEECSYNFFRFNPRYRWQELEQSFIRGILRGAKEVFKTKVQISQQLKINRVTLTKKMKELLNG
ncbi:MAG: Fis family transcriptional regulator [Epsilonproteobacteria bacterium]|jgi:DNA-binding NtrC family response regulator|nr:Fis family transcriptional regulator [Campylobacterota bacterium]NPA89337.1 Fis family transcriptional regulator [Campylobacterota bacterium]